MSASPYADRIRNARWRSAAKLAFDKYSQSCKDLRVLGRRVKVKAVAADGENGEPAAVPYEVCSTEDIPNLTVLTAFPNHALIIKVACIPDSAPAKDGKYLYFKAPCQHTPGRYECFLAYGPMVERCTPEAFLELRKDCSAPLLGFPPAIEIVADATVAPIKERSAHWVGHVFDSNPYEALKKIPDAIPTFAQITLAYLGRIATESNVMLNSCKNLPTCLVSTRAIKKGEVLKTGRPPAYWLDDNEYMEKVVQCILENKKHNIPMDEADLRGMIFGDAV